MPRRLGEPWRPGLLVLFVLLSCSSPIQETIHYDRPDGDPKSVAEGAHCWRCNTRWGDEDLAYHEWHQRELGMVMYASGCKRCRYHGAYKDIRQSEQAD
ncbi:MAG: hypothetical protein QF489_06695 [Planctomycetota bacterium]|nr:hypothetical protein [Planctomycetota bacterium]